jgi:DNA invertase Pin-like site-specific DNA recombinase
MTTTKATAREYLRVSRDESGRLRSPEEQHNDNERAAEAHGWALGAPYVEDGAVSASRYGRKVRPGYAALVDDLEADRFAASTLILWEPSRGSRRLSEWSRLLELLEDRGVDLFVTSHGRGYDLANPRDRRSLAEDGVDSEYESGKTSIRMRRARAAEAANGLPHGRVPYGYRRDYRVSPSGHRELVGQVPEPAEAAVVRELYQRIAEGHSIRSIARDFAARGIERRSGGAFTPAHLRKIATTAAHAGLRTHHGSLTEATWAPIVDRALWHRVQAILTDPARLTYRPGRARHLLSMIARCAECGGPLAVISHRGRPTYTCRDGGHVRVGEADLDEHVTEVILDYLARPDVYREIRSSGHDHDEDLANARAVTATVRAEHNDLADLVGRGEVSATLAARAEPAILRRLRVAEETERHLATPSALRSLITPGRDVAKRWKAAPVAARREVARLLLAPNVLGELRVQRRPAGVSKHATVPVADRVTWRRAD